MRFARFSMSHIVMIMLLVLSFDSSVRAQCPPAYTFTGEAAGDDLGSSVSGAGDVNNDGFADLVVGAHGNDAGGADAGRAYVYSGANGVLLYTFTGEAVDDFFGWSVSGVGDINNDGFADLVVGAYRNDTGGTNAGRAYVYSGANGSLLYTFTGEAANDWFGYFVSSAGDINNDGFADLIVGALAAVSGAGRAYVYSGVNGALLYTFTGEAAGDLFGKSVSGAGDVNSDGFADLIVGAYGNDSGGTDAGRAYVYSGATGALLYTFTAEAAEDFFGWSVSGAGDVNNDGFADLVVGAFTNDAGGNAAGRAYVYSGVNGALLYTFTGEAPEDQFGFSVSGSGDVNNDGFADLVVGAYLNDEGGPSAGRAYVYSGADGALLYTFTGEATGDLFGWSVSGAGDVNNDGFADLVMGARWNDAGGTKAGRAYVYTFPTDACFNSIWQASSALLPNEVCPPWNLQNSADTEIPLLQGDTLVLATSAFAENMRYGQSSAFGIPLSIPDTWVIEFSARYISGTSNDANISHISVQMIADAQLGNFFIVGPDEIFLWSSFGIKGPLANVDTDESFHTYRIEVGSLTDIRVYYDDSLAIEGTTFGSPGFGPTELLTFGDITGASFGESRWLSFKHNAYALDTDVDSDGIIDSCDNCPSIANPLQENLDDDNFGDVCDACPNDPLNEADGDGFCADVDNCPEDYNPDQLDFDGDGRGDACYLPEYLHPLRFVIREFVPPTPTGAEGFVMPIDPQLNMRVTDPDGLVIGYDPADVFEKTITDSVSYSQVGGNDSVVIEEPKTGDYLIEIFQEQGFTNPGQYVLTIRTDGTIEKFGNARIKPDEFAIDSVVFETIPYLPGDCNGSRSISIADATYLIAYIFSGGAAPTPLDAGDANCSGSINISDATYVIAYIFSGGSAPGCVPIPAPR